MNARTNAEKEWLRKMTGKGVCQKEGEKVLDKPTAVKENPIQANHDCHRGFQDVAGMDELKQMVMEGFVNVLNNPECAKAYGITPPSLLFYGPAGCGKTFFAEKIAEEVGINFMKIVPDDLASTLVHGTQEKIKLQQYEVAAQFRDWSETVEEAIYNSPEFKAIDKNDFSFDFEYDRRRIAVAKIYALQALDDKYKQPSDLSVEEMRDAYEKGIEWSRMAREHATEALPPSAFDYLGSDSNEEDDLPF